MHAKVEKGAAGGIIEFSRCMHVCILTHCGTSFTFLAEPIHQKADIYSLDPESQEGKKFVTWCSKRKTDGKKAPIVA